MLLYFYLMNPPEREAWKASVQDHKELDMIEVTLCA